MEHCLHWHVIDEADMVLIEYAVNLDDNDKEGELASFERMLRKLLSMPRQPALLLVNTMELHPPKVRVRVRVSPNPNPNPNPSPSPNPNQGPSCPARRPRRAAGTLRRPRARCA